MIYLVKANLTSYIRKEILAIATRLVHPCAYNGAN